MRVREALAQIRHVMIPRGGVPVENTVAEEVRGWLDGRPEVRHTGFHKRTEPSRALVAAVASEEILRLLAQRGIRPPSGEAWGLFDLDEHGCLWLVASHPFFLYMLFSHVREDLVDRFIAPRRVWARRISFPVEKSTFDIFLTQYARLIRRFDREAYIREYARLGFTHIEVNGLAFPHPVEERVPGEFYADFYTYCPALDQFVSSRLNRGLYPEDYLRKNLLRLKQNARLALKYGLVPGLLCFEPRSVPEAFFKKYPTLRGARVDHPFRSLKPRFNLSIAHPVVQKHYAELLGRLMSEVPELGFLTIWSNDSGAGFEHTKSLYAGRNGGAYMIREWKDDKEIARASASHAALFFRLLRDTASRIHPGFRIITRLEPFAGERDEIWPELRNRIDVEAASLLSRGWESLYRHPRYRDVKVSGSAYHCAVLPKERKFIHELRNRGSRCYFTHAFGPHANHEPLLGIPFPWLTYERLRAAREQGIRALAHIGGIHPPGKVPYPVNQEVFRMFQMDSRLDIDRAVRKIAERFAGKAHAPSLVRGWRLVEEAIRGFVPMSIYSHYGAVWQRLLVRPLVPDIDRIPEAERAYYERFMCTSLHNPNRVDLGRDVLFELMSKEYARRAYRRIDAHVWEPLDEAADLFEKKARTVRSPEARRVFEDQRVRIRALRCLYRTLRNTAVWVYAVHEYLESENARGKARCRRILAEMMEQEIQNTRELLELWETSGVEWMIVSGRGETPFIHGKNFPKLLKRKAALMERHRQDEPFIDPEYMFRIPHSPCE